MTVELTDGWTLRAVGGPVPDDIATAVIPAQVPGCVHLDLLRAGLIPDPYLDTNEAELSWIGRTAWSYEVSFDWPGDSGDSGDSGNSSGEIDLVALGLDTHAAIRLNDTLVAETANMHRSYRFQIGDLLRAGRNVLSVRFGPGLDAAEQASEQLGARPFVNTHPFNAIRKMACNYGWDWGPELVTAGIWRPIAIETWRIARLAAVRPLVSVDGRSGRAEVHVDVARAAGDDTSLDVEVEVAGVRERVRLASGQHHAVVVVDVPDVALWWPHGYGDQPLYPLSVALRSADGPVDTWQRRVGFRTVRLDTTPDEFGTPFTFHVNDVRLFARGVNWIPDDCFPSRIDRRRYEQRLMQARDANVNLVRVWGGGLYESEDFYDACDELGLLVWQDFLFACAAYAEEEPLRSEVIAEAREAVTRLCPHPSLALWNGCNENIWGHQEWDWQAPLAGRTWGWGYYDEVLPGIVAELDPTRPYCPGSPYSLAPERPANDPAHGTTHLWEVWNELDYTAYRDQVPRFVAEFGFQGPPVWSTLVRAVHDEPLRPDSPGLMAHQKAEDGQGKLARGLAAHLPEPRDIADWHWATSLNQARAVQFGIEHLRSWSPRCSGAILWQLNDCWPVVSWSVVDGDGRRKPAWYALRRAFEDRLLTIQPRADGLALIAVNDSAAGWQAIVTLTRRNVDGTVIAEVDVALDVPARENAIVAVPADIAVAADPARELLVADGGGHRAWWYFVEDIDAAVPAPDFDTVAEVVEGGYRLTITARTLLRDVAVLADRVAADAIVDDQLVTLLPGETATFDIRTATATDPAAFTDALVLRHANQLVVTATTSSAWQ